MMMLKMMFLLQDNPSNGAQRLQSFTTLNISIADGDNQPPAFVYAGCFLYNSSCIDAEYSINVQSDASVSQS